MDHLQVKEAKANFIGNSRVLLLKRLQECLSVMNSGGQEIFKGYTYDFPGKQLISPCGRWALKWKLRKCPDKPESYYNQQTNSGATVVEMIE